MIEMKTKQVNKKPIMKCAHSKEYHYDKWYVEGATIKDMDTTVLDQYVNEFAEYDYDLCDICENTEVNGLAVNTWITIEEALVWGATVFRGRVIEETEMMEIQLSQKKHLERERDKAYHKMLRYEAIIKKIRQAMVSHISGE
jgi:hypothetical protein